jgi:uncharacterized protein YggE
MRVVLAIVGLLLLAVQAPYPARAQQPLPQIRTMSIDGIGEVRARPDMATILVGVVQQGGTAGEALLANTQAMNQVMSTLRSLKIAETDIQTSNFQIAPRYDYGPNNQGPPKITGYEVSNQLGVVVRDLPKLGTLLDDIVRVGSNQISSVTFSFANPQQYEDEARVRAVADARHKAGVFAAASGVQLGPVQTISESGTVEPPVPVYSKQMRAEAAAPVPIAAGESVIQSRVTIVWEIK